LVVLVVADQFRADFLEKYRSRLAPAGLGLLLDKGAVFTNCRFQYAVTRTAPGYATLLTGAYSNGHGIGGNLWWDPEGRRILAAEEDDNTAPLGGGTGGSPHHLLASTLGDELKLATTGQSRVFSVALKPRAAILPGGRAANAAYWIDNTTGAFVSSSYYMDALPQWVLDFNRGRRAEKYWNLEWKDASGKVLATTRNDGGKGFIGVVGPTPFATDYQLEFTRELIRQEKLGSGPATDLLILGLSASDFLGHDVGPDAPETEAMILAMDRQLEQFFAFLGRKMGLANVWIALTADHGIAPLPQSAMGLRLPGTNVDVSDIRRRVNSALNARLSPGKRLAYIAATDWPVVYLDARAFAAANIGQAEAERMVGELTMRYARWRGFYTRSQMELGQLPADATGRLYANSASSYGGWWLIGQVPLYSVGVRRGTDHASPFSYDTHVPLVLFGLPFRAGVYRESAEPVDLAPTLATLLGITSPSHSVGRVLTEALAPPAGGAP